MDELERNIFVAVLTMQAFAVLAMAGMPHTADNVVQAVDFKMKGSDEDRRLWLSLVREEAESMLATAALFSKGGQDHSRH
ncbi:hypothetical protein JYU29_05075 [Tianweitania sp. BSSL-BM11]|uniref:Uncharacterized protein n=1 Tax=Tianweitania aestuarii TaxID=2814886 RepID=A0ABS5RV00_9HYPH|nr:hypothetical protein [Tianweitania aestuarii]MBS9720059.1 hypothetical protein [Tianweitania aestuarii]